ncbi:MAG: ATP-binding protein [Bacteroidota bacterium]
MQKLSENISIILGASSILLLITLFIVMLVMAYLKRDLKHLKEKETMEADFEKQLLQSQLETQEETLNKLSIEIHDNVGQLLNSTKLLIGLTQRALPESPETLVMADDTLAKAIQEVRSLSKALNKEWLQQFNFIENLEAEIARINAAKSLHIQLFRPATLTLKADQQTILFRIVQEILQNAIKHASAKNIEIKIKEDGKLLTIYIADDGTGFTESTVIKSVGLLNIKHRTKLLGGTVQWQSSINNGTGVTIQLPVNPSLI